MDIKRVADKFPNPAHPTSFGNHFLVTEAEEHLVCGVAGVPVIPKEGFEVILQIGGEIGVLRTSPKATESDVDEEVLPPFLSNGSPFVAIRRLLNDGKGPVQRTKLSDNLAFLLQLTFYWQPPAFAEESH